MKSTITSAVILCVLILISCSDIAMNKRAEVLDEKIITVGQKDCDFIRLKDAIDAFSNEHDSIYIMDSQLTESGMIIEKKIRIIGLGPDKTVIQGGENSGEALDRIFRIEKTGQLKLEDLSVARGLASGEFRCGGGISNSGSLVMENCNISENAAVYGAGIWNEGTARMINCIVSDNHTFRASSAEIKSALGCTGSGGGIKNEPQGVLMMKQCKILNNSSLKKGGGIFMSCESSTTIENCEIRNNSAVNNGGAIHLRGTLTMKNCKIENNSSVKGVGGFYNLGKLSFSNNTIEHNSGGDFKNGSGGAGFYGRGFIELDKNNWIENRLN